ncbi:MAG: response regulator transcription factor [Phycisphaerales bacterium]|nr:MAG: response regulator transcription factor [Phycisphaerales bacterium]
MATRILLVDDHQILRDGLRMALGQEVGMEVVGEAGDGETAVRLARQLKPDVAIMDMGLPGMTGIDATRRIVADCPEMKIIALSMYPKASLITEMLKAGASGYILKENAFSSVVEGIKKITAGERYLCPKAASLLAEEYARDRAGAGPAGLNDKEREVLKLLAEGKSSKETALLMELSSKSIDTYRRRIMEKLGVASVAELVKIAIREGLASLDD